LLERIETELADVYFDFDKSDMHEDARAALTKHAPALRSILADFPDGIVILEGHCDERGSAEYNLALGDRRAISTNAFLEALGVSTGRLKLISYGEERPQCTESTEGCWQTNRRVHFATRDN
jgi:peptidoglycan-associated lipoprotein